MSKRLHKQVIKSSSGTLVLIPTRNRADLAIAAIRSVISQPDCDIDILVSDNSTTLEDSCKLFQFCEQLRDEHLRYIRPPNPLPMSEHWDWAIQQALQLYNVNHFIYLTDRMIFKPNELKTILILATLYPDKIISYGHDRINDYDKPISIEQNPWTGKIFEIDSSHLLFLSSRCILHMCFPRMLNCIVPRCVLETIHNNFGNIFSSISPDFCFAFRCLETVDSILYYDKMPLIHYALDRSNGAGISRGIMSKDNVDFISNLNHPINFLAPIPEFKTVCNAIIHEYCFVKQETKSPKFQSIDKIHYLQAISRELAVIQNPQLKLEMEELLYANVGKKSLFSLKFFPLIKILRILRKGLYPDKKFNTVIEAMDYATRFQRKKLSKTKHLKIIKGYIYLDMIYRYLLLDRYVRSNINKLILFMSVLIRMVVRHYRVLIGLISSSVRK